MNDSCTHAIHPAGRSTTFYSTALGGQNERQLHTSSTPGREVKHFLQHRCGRPELTTVAHIQRTKEVNNLLQHRSGKQE